MEDGNGCNRWLGAYVDDGNAKVEGLLSVRDFVASQRISPQVVSVMEKAAAHGADAVFFQAGEKGDAPIAQAFVYRHDAVDACSNEQFAERHRKLWSWGGVPLIYRVVPGAVQLFRCSHEPDFERNGEVKCQPYRILELATRVAGDEWWAQQDPWWDWKLLRNGALWDRPEICQDLLSGSKAAHKTLIDEIEHLYAGLEARKHLPRHLQRRLLILSILIAYLEERGVFKDGFLAEFKDGATTFHQVLADGKSLVALLDALETRFNGHVFSICAKDKETLRSHAGLSAFSRFVWGYREADGQLTLWKRYSFADLPIELISHIYQLFVEDKKTAVYTPHFLVRLMVDEALDEDRLDRLVKDDEVILDPACGSGIFLVEAYKRLVLHWRKNNGWAPPRTKTLKSLLRRHIRGVDIEKTAAELTAFSLCLALCDALTPDAIRKSVRLFPKLLGKTIHSKCFFEAIEMRKLDKPVGLILGNPPFTQDIATESAKRAARRCVDEHRPIPGKQLGYLFLSSAMQTLAARGRVCLIQHDGFLYNQKSEAFRKEFFQRWTVREILDFISVRGLFLGGDADVKVVAVLADKCAPQSQHEVLHAVFRRSGRAKARQGFDIDYYDLHWLPRDLPVNSDLVWRCDLLGGGRVLEFAERLSRFSTLEDHCKAHGWHFGVGWTLTNDDVCSETLPDASHVIGKKYVEPTAFNDGELCEKDFLPVPDCPIGCPRTKEIYEPPLLLIHQHDELRFGTWRTFPLTYRKTVFGISAARGDQKELGMTAKWLRTNRQPLRAAITMCGTRPLVAKATAVNPNDIKMLPYPRSGDLGISRHEQILADDIVNYYRDFVRLGESSAMMTECGESALGTFNGTLLSRINGVYKNNPLRALPAYVWPGAICQPYMFGKGRVDWENAEELQGKLEALLQKKRECGLNETRIAILYEDACIYLLKPNRLRYWLRSIALRDSDEILAELEAQGF